MWAAVVTGAMVCGLLAMPSGALAAADTVTVASNGDTVNDGDCGTTPASCTLREALSDVNDNQPEQDRINISLPAVANTINLTSGFTTIDEPVVIANTGLFGAIINGGGLFRIFRLDAAAPFDFELQGLTVTGGNAPEGAAITGSNANVKIVSSTISNSVSPGGAGGGAILVGQGSLIVENSAITGNSTTMTDDDGGAIYASAVTSVTIKRSTISGNHTEDGRGGAIFTEGALTIESSTISGNYTKGSSNGGGGIFSGAGTTTIKNSTIAGNEAQGFPTAGGGIYTEGNSPEPSLSNTIVADNTIASLTGPVPDDLGTTNDTFGLAFSLVEASDPSIYAEMVPGSNLIGPDPQLGPLALNGGPTLTQRPAGTSPVVDKGSTDELTDQRLSTRPIDIGHVGNSAATGADAADIGAVELTLDEGPPVPVAPTPPPGVAQGIAPAPVTPAKKRCKRKRAKKGAPAAKRRCKKRRGG